MTEALVSVVISVYNIRAYLDRCIESVVQQTYTNLEIILVDDGSTDGCAACCDKWSERDSRIKVIHKENAGLGMARNTGIENARGKYLCFFDGDDYVELSTIQRTVTCAEKNSAELVLFGFYRVNAAGNINSSVIPSTDKEFYEGDEIQNYILPELISQDASCPKKSNLWMSACMCLFSAELIQRTGWRFVSERKYISEDYYSLLVLYHDVRRVMVVRDAFYYYCENAKSLTQTYRTDRYEKIKYCYRSCLELCEQLEYGEIVKQRLTIQFFSNLIGAMKLIMTADLSKIKKKQYLAKIVHDVDLQEIIRSTDLRKETVKRRILLNAMKWNMCGIVYYLLKWKS